MRRRRKAFAGQEWAAGDVNRVLPIVFLVFVGFFDPWFFALAFALVLSYALWYGVKYRQRKERERANADAPFWADRIKE